MPSDDFIISLSVVQERGIDIVVGVGLEWG
jgi:hypothetical protein